ncbi:hypothetical protein ACHAWU_005533 [Discostella pseudostelligera]|uniref:Uncharacterized protein n=1 Tax=Discostella pseudostelligera TaxID=259834 RepID=A0ABD3N5Q3_9STRA
MTPITRRQWHHDVRFALSTKDDTTLSQTAMESATLTKTMKSREESFVPPFPTSAEHSLNGHKIIDEQHIPSTEEINKDVVINTQVEDESFNQFNVVNDLVSVSERLLDTLDTTSSTFTTRNAKSYSSLARLSKAHHSMMAKTSNMRRQRFVTGKYPLYVSIKQNPTKKWLGYAESQIYLNGTSIEKSLASYDIFHWLDDKEREELHGDYEFLSLELLAEIHVKKPGYVNILPKGGAGRSLNPSEMQRGGSNGGVFGQWKSWKLRNDDINKIDDTNDESNSSDGERLWVTGFSLTNQRGEMHTLDVKSGVILELLAEIHVKKPGYVNILPKGGAGRSLNPSEMQRGGSNGGVFGQWKSWKLRNDDINKIDDTNDESNSSDGERLWVTGFSLTNQRGEMHTLDVKSGVMSTVNDRTARAIKWPNEVLSIPRQLYTNNQRSHLNDDHRLHDALLVTDGFLVPGKDKGGLYVVRKPGNDRSEWIDCLTGITNLQGATINVGGGGDWFYHRATWIDLTGDGRLSILAARAKILPLLKGSSSNGSYDSASGSGGKPLGAGQLVWLECPKPHSFDIKTGTPLDKDGTVFDPFSSRNTPWALRVLDEGPDVMFSIADLDPSDDTIEIIASQFFNKKLSLHSIKIGPNPKVVFSRIIDDRCGAAFSSVLADLDGLATLSDDDSSRPRVIDSGSTVVSLKNGDAFSHLLVTSHECSFAESTSGHANSNLSRQDNTEVKPIDQASHTTTDDQSKIDGGSLFAYRIPPGRNAWKTMPWSRSVIASGFKVEGQLSNMINPGAPGFCYTFFPTRGGGVGKDKKWHRPLIGLSGDCAESAYILRPVESTDNNDDGSIDKSTKYALMCEIKCKATVGSLAVGYDDLYSAEQQSGYAKIYVPCYEQDKVLVFSMGSGEDEYIEDDGW